MRLAALKKPPLIYLLALQLSLSVGVAIAQTDFAVEKRVVDYLKQNVTPGKPLVVSELYNSVFKAPEERKALDRLFNVFFKIPIFVAQHKAGTNRIPTLADIARQFNLQVPGEVPILLTIMESDPRVPKFISRDAKTGEIISVDIEAVKSGQALQPGDRAHDRGVGWQECPGLHSGFAERKYAEFVKPRRQKLLDRTSGSPAVLPVFSLRRILPGSKSGMAGKALRIVAVNADRFLELETTDAERAAYVKKLGFRFPVAHMNKKMHEDYGSVSVYPTLFLVDAHGIIRKHYVGYQQPDVLAADIKDLLAAK